MALSFALRSFSSSSSSNSSTLSYIEVNTALHDSPAPESTPPTSIADDASLSSALTLKPSDDSLAISKASSNKLESTRSIKCRSLANAPPEIPSMRSAAATGQRNISGDTIVEEKSHAQQELVKAGIQVLDLDWKVDILPGEEMQKKLSAMDAPLKRKSTRLGLLEKADVMVQKASTVLGKRGRGAIESDKGKMQVLKRRATLRARPAPTEVKTEEPAAKKRRVSEAVIVKEKGEVKTKVVAFEAEVKKPAAPARLKRKAWLTQGLYVGQDPEFDPRFSESKNRKKIASKADQKPRRKYLPMPMFGGQRLLERGRSFRLPFDIYSPLPPGQKKPEDWKKVSKNVFIGDAAKEWKVIKHNEASMCACTPDSGCDEDCFNRILFYECDDTNCRVGAQSCTNRAFDELQKRIKHGSRYNVGVDVVQTETRGYGVRSNRMFRPNQIITEYSGEIITQEECDHRMRTLYKDNKCYYLMSFEQNMIIDATRGSMARFVNHSCNPNSKMMMWTVAGKPRVALFAGDQGVMTGEELTYDYNFNPFSSDNIQECRCGAPNCRGVIGPKAPARDIRDALKPLVNQRTGGRKVSGRKRKLQEAIESSIQAAGNKKRKIAAPASAILRAAIDNAKTQTTLSFEKVKSLAKANSMKGANARKNVDPSSSAAAQTSPSIEKEKERELRLLKRSQSAKSSRSSIGSKISKTASITYSRGKLSTGNTVSASKRSRQETHALASGGKSIRVIAVT
ncbi:hypothetical protein MMC25_006083 [Agyrium rufum]|nr:hypothetical protein [Agyrium rufum]